MNPEQLDPFKKQLGASSFAGVFSCGCRSLLSCRAGASCRRPSSGGFQFIFSLRILSPRRTRRSTHQVDGNGRFQMSSKARHDVTQLSQQSSFEHLLEHLDWAARSTCRVGNVQTAEETPNDWCWCKRWTTLYVVHKTTHLITREALMVQLLTGIGMIATAVDLQFVVTTMVMRATNESQNKKKKKNWKKTKKKRPQKCTPRDGSKKKLIFSIRKSDKKSLSNWGPKYQILSTEKRKRKRKSARRVGSATTESVRVTRGSTTQDGTDAIHGCCAMCFFFSWLDTERLSGRAVITSLVSMRSDCAVSRSVKRCVLRVLRSPEHTITTNALYVSDSAGNVLSTNPKEKLVLNSVLAE